MIVIAFPRQQLLCDCASVLRFTYTACVVLFYDTWTILCPPGGN